MTAHNRLAVIVLLGTTQTLGFLNRSGDSSGGRKDAPPHCSSSTEHSLSKMQFIFLR
jgi:hypothetical protein